jgi:hypothetical protein
VFLVRVGSKAIGENSSRKRKVRKTVPWIPKKPGNRER